MALAGDTGATLLPAPANIAPQNHWFGEDQARYILAVPDKDAVLHAARQAGIPAQHIGHADGTKSLTLPGGAAIFMDTLRSANEAFFPNWFA
jgi:phosphoribosylformylglycinamidine synthase